MVRYVDPAALFFAQIVFCICCSRSALPGAVDWHTIVTLTGLLLVSAGAQLIGRFRHERALALFMVLAAAALDLSHQRVVLFILVWPSGC